MFVVTILYPKSDDSSFDIDYYTSTHMPLLADVLGDACHGWGAAAVDDDKYHAVGWATVASKDAFDAAMASSGATVMGDIPNYTNVRPEIIAGHYAGGSQ